jgi:hypothetical protein
VRFSIFKEKGDAFMTQEKEKKQDVFSFALDYVLAHQDELVQKYNGKEMIVNFSGVVGAYDNPMEAIQVGERAFGEGNFAVIDCHPGSYVADLAPIFFEERYA